MITKGLGSCRWSAGYRHGKEAESKGEGINEHIPVIAKQGQTAALKMPPMTSATMIISTMARVNFRRR